MKRIAIFLFLAFIASYAYSETRVKTIYTGVTSYAYTGGSSISLGYRSTVNPNYYGFYHGVDLLLGIGDIYGEYGTIEFSQDLIDILYVTIEYPLGYRWREADSRLGFYLGGGPSLRYIQSLDSWDSRLGLGAFVEIGWETNKSKGVGLFWGATLGYDPIIYSPGENQFEYLSDTVTGTLRVGLSWRRVREEPN